MFTLSVNAYQVNNEEAGAPAQLFCENRYLRVELSGRGGGVVRAEPKDREMPSAVLAAPLCTPERAVLSALREGEDEARAFLGAIEGETGITWELQARVRSSSAALSLAWKTFNRRMRPACAPAFPLRLPATPVPTASGVWSELGGGKLVVAFDHRVAVAQVLGDALHLQALAPALLPPLRTRLVACTVHFVSAPGKPVVSNDRFVVLMEEGEGKLWIHAAEETPSATVFLQLASGETVEAPLSVYPERAAEFALRGLGSPPKRILIRSAGGEVLMDAPVGYREEARVAFATEWERWDELPLAQGLSLLAEGNRAEADALLLAATHIPGLEHAAWFALGLSAMRAEQWLLAVADFEESLLYCGTNPLAWWLKHWCLRRLGEEDENDLPNAHFLAPIEPCLRFEAFLAGGGEKVIAEFRDDPVPFLEVADLLWWCGQEAERQMVLAAGADQTADGLLHLLRSRALQRQGMGMEAAVEEQKAASMRNATQPSRTSELMELQGA
jgi:tetratricopeptide (TPR) repeat protein